MKFGFIVVKQLLGVLLNPVVPWFLATIAEFAGYGLLCEENCSEGGVGSEVELDTCLNWNWDWPCWYTFDVRKKALVNENLLTLR